MTSTQKQGFSGSQNNSNKQKLPNPPSNSKVHIDNTRTTNNRTVQRTKDTDVNKAGASKQTSVFTGAQVKHAVLEASSRQVMSDLIHLNNRSNSNKPNREASTEVSKMKTAPVLGVNDNSKIMGIERTTSIFLSRVRPTTNEEDITKFLSENGIIVSSCVGLKTKYDNYKSFKIGVVLSDKEKILNENLWGTNILVKPFRSYYSGDFRKEMQKSLPT